MVSKVEKDDAIWYECDECGLMFDNRDDAKQHEENCENDDPSYLQ